MTEEFFIYTGSTGSDILTPVSPRGAGKSPRFPELDYYTLLFKANATESIDRTVARYCIQNAALSFNEFGPHAEMVDIYGVTAGDFSGWLNLEQAELFAPPASSSALLEDALEDLKECPTEAHEQSFLAPTQVALRNAEHLLKIMFRLLPRRFEVYPMPTGAIAIQASHAPEIAISVLCEPDGEVLCLVSVPDYSRRAWYSTADFLPDGFLREALLALKQFEE